ncbi:MAG: sugar transferase [Lactobacillaceae bacterium]|nr:sugar transferase [Lactobacillaceae bacterium]
MEQQKRASVTPLRDLRETAETYDSGLNWVNQEKLGAQITYRSVKRMFDFLASLVALVLLSPMFAIVALLIKLDDPKGPVFYSQTRIGQGGRAFRMWKFRSMCVGAEKMKKKLMAQNEVNGAMFKMKDDPRITKIGKFIRKTSIDELPQLWNALIGDMSLVGPRPPLPGEVDQYSEYDKQRLLVQPGCTGLWQVSGRNDVGFHEMVELDIQYIRTRGLAKDIEIMFKTVAIMIHPNGAY